MLTHGAVFVCAIFLFAANCRAAEFLGPPEDGSYLSLVVNRALEIERTRTEVPWSNPQTGNRGVIVIDRTFYRGADRPCRSYRRTIDEGGGAQKSIRGTGCRIGPGLWSVSETSGKFPSDKTRSGAVSGETDTTNSGTGDRLRQPKPTPAAAKALGPKTPRPPKPKPEKSEVTEAPEGEAAAPGKAEVRAKRPAFPTYTLPKKTEL